jgi:hypothetical protein
MIGSPGRTARQQPPSQSTLDLHASQQQQQQQQQQQSNGAVEWCMRPFATAPCVSFGNVRVGQRSRTLKLCLGIDNAATGVTVRLVDTHSWQQHGFSLDSPSGTDSMAPGTILSFRWLPLQPGNVRAAIHATLVPSGQRFTAYLVGHAVTVRCFNSSHPSLLGHTCRRNQSYS